MAETISFSTGSLVMKTETIFEEGELEDRLAELKRDILNPFLADDLEKRIDLAIYRQFEIELEEENGTRN